MISLLEDRKQEIIQIAESHGAHEIRIFGSAAHGEFKPESDIDVIVRLEPNRSLLDLIAIKQDLEDLLGREIHIVTEKSISPYIRESVLKEAVSL